MVDKVKEYIKKELNNISKGYNASLALEHAYGALMFVLDCKWDQELADWWSNVMLPKFEEERRYK